MNCVESIRDLEKLEDLIEAIDLTIAFLYITFVYY